MTSRHNTFETTSTYTADFTSRRSSSASNPDIFSDDYALEPIDPNLELSLEDTDDLHNALTTQGSNFAPYPSIPHRLSVRNRPASTAKTVNTNEGLSARDGVNRTSSVASRLSVPRSQISNNASSSSTQAYAPYPHVARAASIASVSTIRHQERPFVPTGGPEHPYSMHPQNTVTEDDDIGTQPIPHGYSGLAFTSLGGSSNSDVGDIVGVDGHIESLPPYTRFDDNVVAKGDMRDIHNPLASDADAESSERASLMPTRAHRTATASTEQMQLLEPNDSTTGDQDDAAERKLSWREKAHQRVCCGVSLWVWIVMIALISLAGLLGGVIGGVIGRNQRSNNHQWPPGSATTTIYMDADPAVTNSSTPTCPTGQYTIPFNQTEEIRKCVANPAYSASWGCLDIAYLGMSIGRTVKGHPTVQFDDYSVNPQQFLYGPQPPDYNGTVLKLSPFQDRDDKELGVAMYFYQEINKLVILPGYALNPSPKRSVNVRGFSKRDAHWMNQPLEIGDKPWYCFWNNTISEFFIFVEEPANASTTLTTSSPGLPSPTSAPSSSSFPSSSTPTATAAANSLVGQRLSNLQATWTAPPNQFTSYFPTPTPYRLEKRGYTSAYYPTYPKLIKMIEKRKPTGNVPPYCQRMQVLANWQIVPSDPPSRIMIDELQYSTNPAVAKRDSISELESNCICEWMSV